MTIETTNTADNRQNDNTETLNAAEAKQLKSCEASILRGLKAYQNVGKALTIIAQNRLYRATHRTFAQYCRDKWDMTTARASQYQFAYRLHELFTLQGFKVLPKTESQCRPFARIPQDENFDALAIQVWSDVIADSGAITAKLINSYVDSALGIETKSADDNADSKSNAKGTAGAADSADEQSASAELRAEIRALKQKVAYLESALDAEKQAHKRTAKHGSFPKSDLATKLYKAGFRAMAKQCHPDHGGSLDEMKALNELKEILLAK